MPSPISPDIVYELVSVSQPSVAPDGLRVAYVQSSVDRPAMESRSRVMVMDLPGGEARPFTAGPGDTSPRFSPDGGLIAFIRPDGKGRRQVWLISVAGGEATQLTTMAGGVLGFVWSPDSRTLALVSDVDPDIQADDHDPKADPRVRVVRRIQYRYDTLGWRGDAHTHLFIIDTQDRDTQDRGTRDREPVQITDGDWDDSAPVWSPDGSRIAFLSGRREDRDLVAYNEVYVVAPGGGEAEMWSRGLYNVGGLTWSPDGGKLAVVGSDDPRVGPGWQGWLFILEPGQPPRKITDDSIKPEGGFGPTAPPPEMGWTRDGRILLVADSRGESRLYQVEEPGGGLRAIAGGGLQLSGASRDGQGTLTVVVGSSPESPGDLYLAGPGAGSLRRLTTLNGEYMGAHPPAQMEKAITRRRGTEIESRLFLPPELDRSQKYPLILEIHGGPHGAFYDSFNPIQQVLAAAGYVVLCVNPRGSSTYGVDFVKAVLEDWGGEDYLDIMAALDQACSLAYVDTSRLGVHGYSYGGYMTSWIIGHDTRFGAAVVGAPCIDLPSMYGTSDIGVSFGEVQWGGSPMGEMEAFRERSPLTYAPDVQTPALLLHGEADHRCPIEQSEQYFVALKRMGKEVELVRFPGCSHLFLRNGHPRMRQEYLSRMLSWFEKYLVMAR